MESIVYGLITAGTLFLVYDWYSKLGLEYIKSSIDDSYYLVRSDKEDKQLAADILAHIKIKLKNISQHLMKNFPQSSCTKNLINNYNDFKNMSENNNTLYSTSYTVNKGHELVFCLRHKDQEESLVKLNTLMFVALHEFAHVCSKSRDHTPEFWSNFKFIIQEAIKLGIWSYENYETTPVPYCGIMITDIPNI